MRTAIWFFVALCLWWLIATIGCGGLTCFLIVLFFYLPFWLLIVVYCAISEWLSKTLVERWSPLCYVLLTIVGSALLLFIVKQRWPLLFIDGEQSMVPIRMILIPTGAVAILYFIKVTYGRFVLNTNRMPN